MGNFLNIDILKISEWAGALLGVVGSLLIAISAEYLALGFISYLFSNLAWLYFAFVSKQFSLLSMNFIFLCITFVGLSQHVFPVL